MEDYFCEICNKHNKNKSRSEHLKSKSHIEISNCHQNILSLKDVDIDEIDETYSLYMIEHNKKYGYNKVKCQFKLVFDGGQQNE